MNSITTLPVQSVVKLHGYFKQAHHVLVAAPGGFDVETRGAQHSKCKLFADRLIRAPAVTVGEILLKLEAVEWLGQDPLQTLAAIRDDLTRIKAVRP